MKVAPMIPAPIYRPRMRNFLSLWLSVGAVVAVVAVGAVGASLPVSPHSSAKVSPRVMPISEGHLLMFGPPVQGWLRGTAEPFGQITCVFRLPPPHVVL